MVKNIFHAQYRYRGIFINNPKLREEIRMTDTIKFAQKVQQRRNQFEQIIKGLRNENQITVSESDIDFLVSFMALFIRFSIQEAFLLEREKEEKETVNHYVKLLSKQMSLFASPKGTESINSFLTKL